mmetsp:Transcript_31032/g.72119  ORF Transcript_31032/g.72119 Transcript_31032/m.72119 type:complete len:310 (-) Transcript_31032:215-1144(-)
MPMPFFKHGLKLPLVVQPTSSPAASNRVTPSRTGAPPPTTKPARLRDADFSCSSRRMRSEPTKLPGSARLRFAITQSSEPSTGLVVSSKSLPYKQRPASSRSESRAPRPTGFTSSCAISASHSVTTPCCAEEPLGTATSKPSSPVYPERATKQSRPATCIVCAAMKGTCERSVFVSVCRTPAALGPCNARMPFSGRDSTDTSPPLATNCSRCSCMCGRSLVSCPALMTMYRWSPALVMMQSSMMPPSLFVMTESPPIPAGIDLMSATQRLSINATRSAPRKTTPSICDTSKSPAFSRVCRWDLRMPSGY